LAYANPSEKRIPACADPAPAREQSNAVTGAISPGEDWRARIDIE
jgi:hypothetical protein